MINKTRDDLCRLFLKIAVHKNIKNTQLRKKIMHRVLLTVGLTFCITAAPAQPRTPPTMAASHAAKPIKLQRMPSPEHSKLVVKTSEKIVRSSSKNPADRLPLRNESGWPTSSMLLATLLFMGAIALRRHVSGKS